MDQQWNSPSDMPAMSPPSEGGLTEEKPTKWPTVVGVIGIILASLGLMCSCAGFFEVPLQRWGAQFQTNALTDAQIKIGEQFQLVMIILLTIGVGVTLWLLVGCIKLVRRRRSARAHLIGWAMVSILETTLHTAVQYVKGQAIAAELAQVGESQLAAQMWIGFAIGGCIGIAFGLGPQVFTLIWFSRKKIVEEVAQWR